MSLLPIRLKSLRLKKKVMSKSMAEFLSITPRNYQRYETGEIDPPTSKTVAIADYFKVPLDFLIGRGIFENWEEIMQNIDIVLTSIQSSLPEVYDSIKDFDENELINVLPGFIQSIDFTDDSVTINLYIKQK